MNKALLLCCLVLAFATVSADFWADGDNNQAESPVFVQVIQGKLRELFEKYTSNPCVQRVVGTAQYELAQCAMELSQKKDFIGAMQCGMKVVEKIKQGLPQCNVEIDLEW